jgi:hypothetical protein
VCESSLDECGRIVAAEYTNCLAGDGTIGCLCASVECVDENGSCYDVISGPPAER